MATLELINNTVVGAGGASSITFGSIPGPYQPLMIVASARSARTSARYDGSTFRFNAESSGNKQSGIVIVNVGNGALSTAAADANRVSYLFDMPAADAEADTFGTAVCYVPNYAWGEYKTVISTATATNHEFDTNDYENTIAAGAWADTSAVTSIYIAAGVTGFVEHSTFTLYGINSA